MQKESTNNDIGEERKKLGIECICPKCGRHHMMMMHWIGRGMPRKFCTSCRESSGD